MPEKAPKRFLVAVLIPVMAMTLLLSGCGKPQPERIEITPGEETVAVGDELTFVAAALSAEGEAIPEIEFAWSLEGDAGTIDASGRFTAARPGEATIVARTGEIAGQARAIVVPAPVATLELAPEAAETLPETSVAIRVSARTADDRPAGFHEVTLATPTEGAELDAQTATLDESGQAEFTLTAPPIPGTVRIEASIGETETEIEIVVNPRPVTRIDAETETERAVSESEVTIRVTGLSDEDRPAIGNEIVVSSPTEGLALSAERLLLDADGAAELKATLSPTPGENRIVLAVGDISRELTFEGTPVERLEIAPRENRFEIGQRIAFEASALDAHGNSRPAEVEWTLSGDIAALEDDAVLMEKSGSGILFARLGDISQGHPFTVAPGTAARISLSPERAELKAGDSLTFAEEIFNAQDRRIHAPVTWETTGDIGVIGADGVFQARTVGEGEVIAIGGEVRATAPVTVSHGALADIAIELERATLTAGEPVKLSAEGIDAFGNRFPVAPRWFLSVSLGAIDPESAEFMPRRAGKGDILARIDNIVRSVAIEVVAAEPSRLELVPRAADIAAGQTVQFEATGYDRFGNPVAMTPEFSIREALGEIDETGLFTAKTAGNAVVRARAENLEGESTVAVTPAEMSEVRLAPEGPMELTAGAARKFSAAGFDAFGNTVEAEIVWDVQPELGPIDARGVFSPQKAGKTRVIAGVRQLRTGKTVEAAAEIVVVPGETIRIQIEPASVDVVAGDSVVFVAEAFDAFRNKTDVQLQWELERPSLGEISPDGRFSAVRAESGVVRVRHANVSAEATVRVSPARVAFVKIIPESIDIQAGESIALDTVMEDRFGNTVTGDVLWELSDRALGRISEDNVFTARSAGEGAVIAAAYDIAETAPLVVRPGPLRSLALNPRETEVPSGTAFRFEAVGRDEYGNPVPADLRWEVDEAIGRIDETGEFTAEKAGAGNLTVSSGDFQDAAEVRVVPGAPAEISLETESFVLTAGDIQPLAFEVRDGHGNRIPSPVPDWSIPDDLGTVDARNRFRARKAGQGTIRLSVGEATADIAATVEPGPIHTVTIAPEEVELAAGDQLTFQARGFDAQGNLLEPGPVWSSSGHTGTIDPTGVFRATTTGDGFVTVRMESAGAVARVRVSPGPVHRLIVEPEAPEIPSGDTVSFSATAFDAFDNPTPAEISWSLEADDSIGELSDDARFRALRVGQAEILAATGEVSGAARVTVVPGALDEIRISPEAVRLRSGEFQRIEVSGRDAFGNERPVRPTFAIEPGTLGEFDAEGVFAARKAGSGQLRVSADGVSAEIPATIEAGPVVSLEIRIPGETLRGGNTYAFEAVGLDAGGNEFPVRAEWSVSRNVGRIERSTGIFHARAAGTGLVVAAGEGLSARRTIVVEAGVPNRIFIEPNPAEIRSDEVQVFEVSGQDVEGNPVAISEAALEWEAVGNIGVFEEAGRFRATRMGRGKVVARNDDLMAEASATVIPGEPDPRNSRIRAIHPNLPADGESFSEILLEVRDRHNNPVPGIQPTLVSSRQGDRLVQPDESDANGQARGRIRSSDPGESILRGVVNGAAFVDTARVAFE